MKLLLRVIATVEALAGLTFAAVPGLFMRLLLDTDLTEPAAILLARLTGIALVSLAIICWQNSSKGTVATGTIKGMLFYNVAASAILAYAALEEGMNGVGVWPAILLHAGLAFWCIRTLLKNG